MKAREIVEQLTAIERRFDVNSLQLDDVHLWPIIRLRISQLLFLVDAPAIDHRPQPHRATSGPLARLFRATRKVWSADFRSLAKLQRHQKLDVLFHESPDFTRESLPEGAYDRQIDSTLDFVARSSQVLKIGLLPPYGPNVKGEAKPTLRLDVFPYVLREKLLRHSLAIPGFESLRACIREVSNGRIDLTEQEVISDFRSLRAFSKFYADVLARAQPRLVMFSTFFSIPNMALTWAARKASIPTVEIQHGMQGIHHAMNSHWTALPPNGYGLLPDNFWVWGQESVENILRYRTENYEHHQPIVGGNLWLSRWLKNRTPANFEQEITPLKARIGAAEKVVLVALQPIHNRLPDQLVDSIRKSPDSWLWLIRVHPQQREDLPLIKRELVQRGASNFDIEYSTRLPLYFLLNKAHHFVTVWSSSAYEALAMRLPVTVITAEGAEAFQNYVKLGLIEIALSADELLASISRGRYPRPESELCPYIEVDEKIADEALKFLFNKWKIK